MNKPHFLTLDEVLQIHAYQIEQHGGDEGIRDVALLESALAQPHQQFGGEYLHQDLPAMAAAYLFHIVSNHAFADGNKRTGTHAAVVFLALNGVEIDLPVDEAEEMVLRVADRTHPKGHATTEEVADFFRRQLDPSRDE